ncbi:hypothetical protein F2Q69_00010952 [Brassica cretica]|uniref:ethanolamine-phosphate cytidylyltransferase n=1 Tax=Brassica cretica TaxID=69181 RepID=A0A8S9R1V1_BRACR|nr:hypothetical protein F2Q69_00010952 [Brassica cretica]
MVWEKEKIVGTCLLGGAAFAVGASFLHLFLKGDLPLGLGLGTCVLSPFRKRKPVRVYMDGCFDMMHYGHCNALRQARALGDQLVVGVVSDEEIIANKGPPGPGPDARVVYIDGAFDLFHAGHVEILRRARELGDFLLVGIHNDQTVSAKRGAHRPIMNLHERSLSVLACRYVDEVIIGAPWEVSKDTITTFDISLVVHGTVAESDDFQREEENPYAVPISMGIFQVLESPLDITTSTIIRRIVANHEAYQASCYSGSFILVASL